MGLEYMLISNAVRLAQAQGMHLNRTDLPVVPPEDAGKRDSLWWLLYAYDKHLACRSGRPSVRSLHAARAARQYLEANPV